MVDPNTRQGKRTPVTLKIKFKSETLEQFIERYAVDVSQGGIFIRTKEPLAVGTQMKFEFQLRDASPLIGGEGTVVWTRENDPSRPAIAPGMGVRFDRLAEGSQAVLERILSEKAKQAPNRAPAETTKPPMFTDVPTRVAPAPVQDALLGNETARRRSESYNDQHTPLPKPIPFHSDADEFPEEAFEEATKVRALDELIAATAGAEGADAKALGQDLRRARNDATHSDPAQTEATAASERAVTQASRNSGAIAVPSPSIPPPAYTPGGAGASGPAVAPVSPIAAAAPAPSAAPPTSLVERESAPVLPSPPERAQPKLLDTSPSPRAVDTGGPHISGPVMGNVGSASFGVSPEAAKTRIGLEPARAHTPSSAPPSQSAIRAAETRPSGMRAVAAEETSPSRLPAKKKSNAGAIIAVLVVLALGGAAAWWFVIRPRAQQHAADEAGSGSGSAALVDSGSAGSGSAGSGSAGSGSAGSAAVVDTAPKADLVDTVIGSSIEKSTVAVVGTDQAGPAPLTAKLEKGKAYKARVTAPGYLPLELDVKGGDAKQTAKLQAKPHVVSATSEPAGALIYLDGAPTGHATPFDLELTKAQAAKKTVRIQLRKSGFRPLDKVIAAAAYIEVDEQLVAKVEGKLAVAPAGGTGPVIPLQQPPHDTGSGSAAPPPDSGPVTSPSGGSAATPPPDPKPDVKPETSPEPKPEAPKPEPKPEQPQKPASDQPQKPAAEPEPDFNKNK